MKKTSLAALAGLFLLGAVGSYLFELVSQSRGSFIFIPPYSLSFTLVLIAIAAIAMALPIRRRLTGKNSQSINPFYAARVVALAKASSLAAAVFLGIGVGVLAYVLGRPIAPTGSMLGSAIAEIVSSGILLAAGLISEWWCALPPDDQDKEVAGEPAA